MATAGVPEGDHWGVDGWALKVIGCMRGDSMKDDMIGSVLMEFAGC